jgi:RecA/RadA recombinase
MAVLKKRKMRVEEEVESVGTATMKKKTESLRFDKVISTGSTLLDLSISCKRKRGGGIPGGSLIEIYGPSAAGKTQLLMDICASAQYHGGICRIRDPESRLDQEYAEMNGVSLDSAVFDYARPDTVKELFDDLYEWEPGLPNVISVFGADSIAALSTEMEMEEEDKRGQKQAKEFSQNLRKTARKIGMPDRIVVFTNQVRQGENGETTPCGKAMEFYGSLRIRVGIKKKFEVEKKLASGATVSKVKLIESNCYIKKSSMDDPYRECPIFIKFGYGIDDVRGNLQWYKDMRKDTLYDCITKKYQNMEKAVQYIEENHLEKDLRERVIDLWDEIEALFTDERKPKVRF